MGPTGTGKSTVRSLLVAVRFSGPIVDCPENLLRVFLLTAIYTVLSGSNLAISRRVGSCTSAVQAGNVFDVDGRRDRHAWI